MTLTSQDKDKVKRFVPKASNKIIDAAIIRLYVNYPDPQKWNWSGLTGALVLVDDLIGHTFFFKLVDIIGNQGVLWDQELWVDFQYSQDRLFFHSFEIEDYSIGFLFDDKSDAQHFFKRVQNRSKHGSKLTIQNNNAVEAHKKPEQIQSKGYRGEDKLINNEQRMRRSKGILYYDNEPPPEWRSFYKELENMGITEDMIAENREFIKDYISKQGGPLVGLEPPIPRRFQNIAAVNKPSTSLSQAARSRSTTVSSMNSGGDNTRRKKAPPPPPPPTSSSGGNISTPTPPPSITPNDSYQDISSYADRESSVSASIGETSTPTQNPTNKPETHRVHAVPPPMTFPAQKLPPPYTSSPSPAPGIASSPSPLYNQSALPSRLVPPPPPANVIATNGRPLPNIPVRNAIPPPPPSRGNVPPAPPPNRTNGSVPAPPPPRRGPAPPPPPSRHNPVPQSTQQQAQSFSPPPTLPPGHPGVNIPPSPHQMQQQQLPPRPVLQQPQVAIPSPQFNNSATSSPPPPPPSTVGMPTFTSNAASVPPPPPPPSTAGMPTFTNNGTGAPPPPPPAPPATGMPNFNTSASAPPLVEITGDSGRDALLASIRGAGIGSLKKVDKSQLDKPSVLLQEARGEPVSTPSTSSGVPSGAPSGPPNGQPASLADALAAALISRKAKVAVSDDESDGDW